MLLFETLPGLIIGIVVSLLLLLRRSATPAVTRLAAQRTDQAELWVDATRHPDAHAPAAEVLVLRVEGDLFFANAEHVRERVRALAAESDGRFVVLDGETTPAIDVTAATMLPQLDRDLARDGVTLALARVLGPVNEVLEQAVPADELPPRFLEVGTAVATLSQPHGRDPSRARRG